jgi:glycosyltransferase involved in cell wall biosynthesis
MPDRLRIAQVAPLAGPVIRETTDSIEHLMWLLTEELSRRGHDVTLFAAGSSQTSAKLQAVYPRGYDADESLCNWEFHEVMHVASAFEQAHEFDVIHSHAYHHALPFTRLVNTPVLHTYHILPDDDIIDAFARCPEAHVVAITQYQRRKFKGTPHVAVVPHGIDIGSFPFNPARGNYLLFLGRVIPSKGSVEAVHVARQVGMRLVIAGSRENEDEGYFDSKVAPLIDGKDVEYVGEVSVKERNLLLAGAAALLYPINASEPFGLVLIEAMACGTPVVAMGRGAVPEIVDIGVTGYLALDLESLASLIPAALELDRARVRETAVARFDYRRMVDDYQAVYQRLVDHEAPDVQPSLAKAEAICQRLDEVGSGA